MSITHFLTSNKDLLTLLVAIYAAAVSTLNVVVPRMKELLERRKAIFQALQEDRKAIALVTIRVVNRDWDSRLRKSRRFRARLLQSLAVAAGLESSDRGKAYVLAALKHIAGIDDAAKTAALKQLRKVEETFQGYVNSGADPKFEKDRLVPLRAIIEAVATQHDAAAGTA